MEVNNTQQPIVQRIGSDFRDFYSALRSRDLEPNFIEIDNTAAAEIRRQNLVYNKPIKKGDRIYFLQTPNNVDRGTRHWLIEV